MSSQEGRAVEIYRTLTGRRIDLASLTQPEREALAAVRALYRRRPTWDEFAQEWISIARSRAWSGEKKIPVKSTLYRVCQDLELRLGIAEGQIAAPDYRDRLADLIAERFESRYAFCKTTGIDQGNLSHVLAGRKHFSPETLFRILEALGVQIELVGREDVFELAADPFAADERAERLRQLDHRVTVLENLAAKGEACVPADRPGLLGAPGLWPDELDDIRGRVQAGENFDRVLDEELGRALNEKANLAREIASAADKKREARTRAAS